jgi:AraC-like DNA-binding protein
MDASRPVSARTTVLVRSDLATVAAFDHGDGDAGHRDPAEERFDGPTIVLTERGRWHIGSGAGAVDADPDVVVLGAAGRSFRCRHDERRPTDRTMYVEYRGGSGEALEPDGPVFRRAAVPRSPAVARIHAALRREIASPGPAHRLKVDALAADLLVESLRAGTLLNGRSRPAHPDIRDRVVAARTFLDEHLEEEVTLPRLAAEVGLSPWYLARRFREVTGTSPHRYLVEARLDRAEQLLGQERLTVTQVCHRVGFGSLGHFIGAFRSRTGLPPARWRDATRNRNH